MSGLLTRLHAIKHFPRAPAAHICNRGVSVMRSDPLLVFSAMVVPTLAQFEQAYPLPLYNHPLCRDYWNALSADEKRRAVFYIPYAVQFWRERNTPMHSAAVWLYTKWWTGIPISIQERLEAVEIADAPSLVPPHGAAIEA